MYVCKQGTFALGRIFSAGDWSDACMAVFRLLLVGRTLALVVSRAIDTPKLADLVDFCTFVDVDACAFPIRVGSEARVTLAGITAGKVDTDMLANRSGPRACLKTGRGRRVAQALVDVLARAVWVQPEAFVAAAGAGHADKARNERTRHRENQS